MLIDHDRRLEVRQQAHRRAAPRCSPCPSGFILHAFTRPWRLAAESQLMCVELHDLASVSPTVRSVSDSVRPTPASVSANVRQKQALIARRAVHPCASLHICCCKPEPAPSTARSGRCSNGGIQGWPTTILPLPVRRTRREHHTLPHGPLQ